LTSEFTSQIAPLSDAKRQLVRKLLRGEAGSELGEQLANLGFVKPSAIVQHDALARFDKFPLTEMQQAYWVGRQKSLELGNVAIHSYLEIRLDHLHVSRLQVAWNEVIRRHDMLRAVILPDGQQQVMREVTTYEIRAEECEHREACELRRTELREKMSHQVFDPRSWPLFALVVTEGPECGTDRRLEPADYYSRVHGALRVAREEANRVDRYLSRLCDGRARVTPAAGISVLSSMVA
jgi:hypothetical protein